MKLKSVRITDFRSIRDSNEFEVTDVTGLVGKNESGKTAILQALYRLNPIAPEQGHFDVTDDYPRADVEEYRQGIERGDTQPAIVVRATYLLDAEEIQEINENFGNGVLTTGTFTLCKSYANEQPLTMPVNEVIAGNALLAQSDLSDELKGREWNTLSQLSELLTALAEEKTLAFTAAQAELAAITDSDERTKAEAKAHLFQESSASKLLRMRLAQILQLGLSQHIWTQSLVSKLA
jgi:hypothetical protein